MAFTAYTPLEPTWPLGSDDQLWLAPAIGDPTDPENAAEPRDKWYERQRLILQATVALPTVNGEEIVVTNQAAIEWAPAAADWGNVTHIAILAGKRPLAFTTVIGYAPLTAARSGMVARSDVLTIPKGSFQVPLVRESGQNVLKLAEATASGQTFHNFFRQHGTLSGGDFDSPTDLDPQADLVPDNALLADTGDTLMADDEDYLVAE